MPYPPDSDPTHPPTPDDSAHPAIDGAAPDSNGPDSAPRRPHPAPVVQRRAVARPAARSTALSLEVLGDSEASLRALVREGSADNTVAAYQAAMRYWEAWYGMRYGGALPWPVPETVVLQFVADHVEHQSARGMIHDLPKAIDEALVACGAKRAVGPYRLTTVMHRVAVLSEAHESQGLANPCHGRAVRTVLAKTRSAYARRGERPVRKEALTREPLEQLLDTCDDSLIGLRDRALLLFAWASGGRRRSEVVRATCENTRRTPEGFVYSLSYGKNNQEGRDRANMHKPIVGRAAEALQAWLDAAGIRDGALFRRVRRGGNVGEALGAEAVRRIVQARALAAGLDGDFGAHSLRSGFVTEAGRQGVPLAEVMAMTGHVSVATAMHYHQAGAVSGWRGGRLLDEPAAAHGRARSGLQDPRAVDDE
ncbi:site-specific integrase [Achromobacter sp. GG226]|nr:site-specific integrase [Verticiella sp. GG226]